ncbi:membrane protein [Limoniibacter endophyticus]|uniref:Membrane protein n=2 Tax=Limoniibacter endophyticus TaxID=1565040 RepID=A0A8J3GF47_9HYPH|nr:membrane protein [Limoniibacter endophyticus]
MSNPPAIEAHTERHSILEDAMALIMGTLLVSLGMLLYTKSMLLVGSTAGIALLLQYISGYSFGLVFFIINLPFYLLAWKRLGWKFTLRTFIAVGLVSIFSRLNGDWIDFSHLSPLYAAIIGGMLSGVGLLILFRHRTGLGGINILAIYLQENFGIRAGFFQLGLDLAILVASLFVLSPEGILLSIIGATILNVILAVNHKPGRYHGFS